MHLDIRAENDGDAENITVVQAHMQALMRMPTIRAGAVMPDAGPTAKAPGTIPVGGVVATENAIHPGFHSADICCSMAKTSFSDDDPRCRYEALAFRRQRPGARRPIQPADGHP